MTREKLLRHLIEFDVPLDDPIVTVPQSLVAQEAEDMLAGKSDYISYDVIKFIQDTIIQVSVNAPDPGSEQNKERIKILAELQETISEWSLQERPALKNQQKHTVSPDLSEKFRR